MSWNYRVVRKSGETGGEKWETFGIHEVFYDKQKRAATCTENPIEAFGETLEELRESYKMQAEAFNAPALDFDKIPEDGAKDIGE